MAKKNTSKRFELRISNIAFGGCGVGRKDGFVYFVNGSLPNELILAEEVCKKKNYGRAKIIKIIEFSPYRIKPLCPYQLSAAHQESKLYCPACSFQQITYEKEISIKNKQFFDFLSKNSLLPENEIDTPVKSPTQIGYRNKMTLHSNGIALGYKSDDNSSIKEIARCAIAHPDINKKLLELKSSANFADNIKKNSKHYFRYSNIDGIFYFTENTPPPRDKLIRQQTPIGHICVPLSSFFQTNDFVCEFLIKKIMQIISEISPKRVIDLYCGCGIFALAAAKSGVKFVDGADCDENAIKAAKINAFNLGLQNTKFFSVSAEKILGRILPEKVENTKTVAILDPPRTGLSKKIVGMLLRSKIPVLIYISCAPDTLTRDLKILSSSYKIIKTGIFDMFPRTPHFETLTILKLQNES